MNRFFACPWSDPRWASRPRRALPTRTSRSAAPPASTCSATTTSSACPTVEDADSERNSALFGLRLGVFFNDMIGVEGEFGVIPSEARTMVFDVWNLTYRAHLVVQFRADEPETKLIPFVLGGGGAPRVVSRTRSSDRR